MEARQLSLNLRRLPFKADEIALLEHDCSSQHVKLFFPKPGQEAPLLPDLVDNRPVWKKEEDKPLIRTYSVSHHDRENHLVSVDFVIHDGPASVWAQHAQVGDCLGVSGPGDYHLPSNTDQPYIFVGDLSALPAIKAVVEKLPKEAEGHVLLQVPDKSDRLGISLPENFDEIHWLSMGGSLLEAVKSIDIKELRHESWIAGESSDVVEVKRYLKARGLLVKNYYAVPYWKKNVNEEAYHKERHQIMDDH